MIHIDQREEPADFDNLVRRKGQRFLLLNPHPTSKQWRNRRYWRDIASELHDTYDGICAYSCHWIPYDTGTDTVEHFRPKALFPEDAYEWRNYRLVCATLNGRKGLHEDVLARISDLAPLAARVYTLTRRSATISPPERGGG